MTKSCSIASAAPQAVLLKKWMKKHREEEEEKKKRNRKKRQDRETEGYRDTGLLRSYREWQGGEGGVSGLSQAGK